MAFPLKKKVFGKLKTKHYQQATLQSDFAMFSNYFTINSLCYVLLYHKFSWFYPYGFGTCQACYLDCVSTWCWPL
ncbi:hypothetical protein CR513_15239, partial [Mucuna pruriens]